MSRYVNLEIPKFECVRGLLSEMSRDSLCTIENEMNKLYRHILETTNFHFTDSDKEVLDFFCLISYVCNTKRNAMEDSSGQT